MSALADNFDDLDPDLKDKTLNALAFAEKVEVGLFAREASEYAPDEDRALDTVVLVLRGESARRGREAVTALADLLREAVR